MPKTKPNGGKLSPAALARIDKLVKHYLAIRARKAELKEEYEQACKPLNDLEEQLTERMLGFLDSTGVESARTKEGTVYAYIRPTASLSDPDAFMAFVMQHGLFELLDRRANATACREHAEEFGSLPPGVRINSTRRIGVRTQS